MSPTKRLFKSFPGGVIVLRLLTCGSRFPLFDRLMQTADQAVCQEGPTRVHWPGNCSAQGGSGHFEQPERDRAMKIVMFTNTFTPDIVHSHHPFLLGDTALRVSAARDLPVVFTHHTQYEQYTHYVPGDSEVTRHGQAILGPDIKVF